MRNAASKQNPWTKGEKFLLGAILLTVALATLGVLWGNRDSAMPHVAVPSPTMPVRNAYDTFLAASVAVNGNVDEAVMTTPPVYTSPRTPPHLYSPTEKATLLRGNAVALSLLRRGLTQPYQNPPIRSFSQGMPYYARFRHLARLLTLDSQVRESQGNWAGAVGSGLDSVQLGTMIPRGAPIIGMLVGNACQAIGRYRTWGEVEHLDAAQAKVEARRMEAILKAHVPYAEVLQEEKWAGQAGLMETFRKPGWRAELREVTGYEVDSGARPTPGQWAQALLISRRSVMNDYTETMDQYIQNAHQPYAVHPEASPSTDFIANSVADVSSGARFRDAYSMTENALLLICFALRAYKAEHGAYPATLAALVPAYLTASPDDPFASSGPLRYQRLGKKYLLYSIGPDGKDDGGKPIFDATKSAPKPGEHDSRYYVQKDSTGDMVAGLNE